MAAVYIEPKRLILCVLHHPKYALHHPKFYHYKTSFLSNIQIYIVLKILSDNGKQEEQKKSLQQSSACFLQKEKETVRNCYYITDYINFMYLFNAYRTISTQEQTVNPAECRVINIDQLNKHIKNVVDHFSRCHSEPGSLGERIILSGEKNNGLASIFSWKCNSCGQEMSFSTSTKVACSKGNQYWTSNLAAVWGQMVTGGGFNPLQESMSVLGIPVMSKQSFMQTEHQIGQWWWDALQESITAAGKEEKQFAIAQGSYHQGIPAITVIVDGGWSKRTHKHSYNALSGVGVIFGKHTGKLLYIGVRNKYCAACINNNNTQKKTNHICFKNWNCASASMEPDIILEGFRMAEQQHGVRYTKFIGDGDSSVHAQLISGVSGWGYAIQKQECANHAVKCFRSSLEKLVKEKPQYKGKGKLTEQMRKRLASSVRCAIINRSKLTNRKTAVQLLQKDILNCALHCFGSHHKCSADYCKVVRNLQSTCNPVSLPISIPCSSLATIPLKFNVDDDSISTPVTVQDLPACDEGQLVSASDSQSSDLSTFDCMSTSTTSNDTSNSDHESLASSNPSDDTSNSDCGSLASSNPSVINDEIERDTVGEILKEQQTAWEDATDETQIDPLEPGHPIDNQMICDIQSIASRLVGKAEQLLGKSILI